MVDKYPGRKRVICLPVHFARPSLLRGNCVVSKFHTDLSAAGFTAFLHVGHKHPG